MAAPAEPVSVVTPLVQEVQSQSFTPTMLTPLTAVSPSAAVPAGGHGQRRIRSVDVSESQRLDCGCAGAAFSNPGL